MGKGKGNLKEMSAVHSPPSAAKAETKKIKAFTADETDL
jgi:hypothetical protein